MTDPIAVTNSQRGKRLPRVTLNSALLASNAVFFFLSASAVVASIAVFLLTRANDRAKDRDLMRYQAEAAEKIADLTAAAERARLEAQNAKLQTERIKLQVSWRSISQDDVHKLRIFSQAFLKEVPITLNFVSADAEALNFADEIYKALNGAGPNMKVGASILGLAFTGVKVAGSEGETRSRIVESLAAASIKATVEAGQDFEITVGSKAPPKF